MDQKRNTLLEPWLVYGNKGEYRLPGSPRFRTRAAAVEWCRLRHLTDNKHITIGLRPDFPDDAPLPY